MPRYKPFDVNKVYPVLVLHTWSIPDHIIIHLDTYKNITLGERLSLIAGWKRRIRKDFNLPLKDIKISVGEDALRSYEDVIWYKDIT